MYYLYILRNPQNKLYIGISSDLDKRVSQHNSSRGAKLTKDYQGFKPVYIETYSTLKETMDREKQLKQWSRAKKEALIKGDLVQLKNLSRSGELSHGVK